jgi:acetyl esterase/lipase
MGKKYLYNKELLKYVKYASFGKLKFTPFVISIVNLFSSFSKFFSNRDSQLKIIKYKIKGYLNKDISVYLYTSKKEKSNTPALLYFHGGGFFLKGMANSYYTAKQYAQRLNVKVIYVDYRLAPKYPYPYAIEDAYSALLWVDEQADILGIDRQKIAVTGDSAGGMISATLCHMSRDRKGPKIIFQMLIYPVIDSKILTESMEKYDDTPVWNSNLTKQMWKYYIKDEGFKPDYTSLLTMESYLGLPSLYIEPQEYDCLRDEALEYAKILDNNHVGVTCNLVKGSFHGVDIFKKTKFVQCLLENRIEVLKKAFGK